VTPVPLDFGLVATPAIAARLAGRTLGRLLVWNVSANFLKFGSFFVLAAPFYYYATHAAPISKADITSGTAEAWWRLFVIFLAAVVCGLDLLVFDLVLIPAGDLVLLDGTLRKRTGGFFEDLRSAAARVLSRIGPLILTCIFLVLVLTTASLVVLPFLMIAYLAEAKEFLGVGVVCAVLSVGAAVGTFGLALPAVMLEHRTAVQAFERAWRLARLRPWTSAALGAAVAVGGLALSTLLSTGTNAIRAGDASSDTAQIVSGLLFGVGTLALDIAWVSILLCAYHGLVAEEAEVVGRRSAV
jgi:hypothetical protein